MDLMGRKWTMVLYSLPLAAGFACYVVAGNIDNKALIYLGRFQTGVKHLVEEAIEIQSGCNRT